jgi:Flp pilus assembly protein TadG
MSAVQAAFCRFRQAARHFVAARSGNVAVTFALATLPIIGAVGATIDYSRANAIKASMQAALDSTALMLRNEAATDTESQLQTNASNYFKALFNPPGVQNISVSVTYSNSGGSTAVVHGSASIPTTFAAILGVSTVYIGGSSTAKWGSIRLRVALVLDNTGSMASSGKMAALQTATKNLLSQLNSAASTNGDVYVSIIPFNKDVNVGTGNYNEFWLRWDLWDAANGTCSDSSYKTQSSCTSHGKVWTPANHNTWNGCITDRGNSSAPGTSAGYDQDVTQPTSSISTTQFPSEQYSACPQAMKGLSYDWTSMNTLVNNMVANGTTNQPIGLVWGWQSLVGGGPLTAPAMDSNYQYHQIIILLSDGLNTADRWYSNQSSVDTRMYDSSTGNGTCANIKAAGITIYTIQVNTGGDPTSTLLQNCASNTSGTTDHFFLLTTADQILTTFNTIGTNLTKLRIAQ